MHELLWLSNNGGRHEGVDYIRSVQHEVRWWIAGHVARVVAPLPLGVVVGLRRQNKEPVKADADDAQLLEGVREQVTVCFILHIQPTRTAKVN